MPRGLFQQGRLGSVAMVWSNRPLNRLLAAACTSSTHHQHIINTPQHTTAHGVLMAAPLLEQTRTGNHRLVDLDEKHRDGPNSLGQETDSPLPLHPEILGRIQRTFSPHQVPPALSRVQARAGFSSTSRISCPSLLPYPCSESPTHCDKGEGRMDDSSGMGIEGRRVAERSGERLPSIPTSREIETERDLPLWQHVHDKNPTTMRAGEAVQGKA